MRNIRGLTPPARRGGADEQAQDVGLLDEVLGTGAVADALDGHHRLLDPLLHNRREDSRPGWRGQLRLSEEVEQFAPCLSRALARS